MKKSLKVSVMGAIAIVLLTSATWWFLQYTAYSCGKKNLHSLARADWTKELKLSKEQQQKLAELEAHVEPQFQKSLIQLSQVRLLLCDLLRKSELKEKDIEKYTNEIARIQAEEEKLTVLHLFNMKKILTPEQDSKFFSAIMKDICVECRNSTGIHDCQCGLCNTAQEARK